MKQQLAGSPFEPAKPGKVKLRYLFDNVPGITRRRAGSGFTYLWANGRRLADPDQLKRIRFLAIPPAWEQVWICPFANGHLQATGRDARGRKQYLYHPLWCARQDRKKYARMLAFGQVLPKVRRAVARRLRQPRPTLDKVVAAVIALLDQTGMRIGNESYRKENNSHGLTTLRDNHVRFVNGSVEIACRGKSGMPVRAQCDQAKLVRVVRQCRDLDGPVLFQYIDEQGRRRRVHATHVNAYLAELAGPGFTAKDFRTWHGTTRAAGLLRQCQEATSKTARERNVRQVVREVAGKLCNLPSTCRKHYIHPALFEAYLSGTLAAIDDDEASRRWPRLAADERLVMQALTAQMREGTVARPCRRSGSRPRAAKKSRTTATLAAIRPARASNPAA